MSVHRKVTDFLVLQVGSSGTRQAIMAGAVASAILASTLGFMPLRASAGPCTGPDEYHLQGHTDHSDYDEIPHENHDDHDDNHTHSCSD